MEHLETIAGQMVQNPMGILAADESTATIGERFKTINIENNIENRQAYRELLFGSSQAMKDYIGGVILFDETLRQNAADGTPFATMIADANAAVGIKVDLGARDLAGHPDETVTEGLDGLRERLREYHELGARFAKWRAVIAISDSLPSAGAIKANAHALARYAALCQETGLVPIVEPEVQMDKAPADHSIERCYEVTSAVLKAVFDELYDQRIALEGMVLKPNMVIAGINAKRQDSPERVAELTLSVLREHVPAATAGIAFLSGGQSDLEATANLNAMNAAQDSPWPLTFSYGRALQDSCRQVWNGKEENVKAAREAFSHRAKMNSLAAQGAYDSKAEDSK